MSDRHKKRYINKNELNPKNRNNNDKKENRI